MASVRVPFEELEALITAFGSYWHSEDFFVVLKYHIVQVFVRFASAGSEKVQLMVPRGPTRLSSLRQ